jgi:hypothetical protein
MEENIKLIKMWLLERKSKIKYSDIPLSIRRIYDIRKHCSFIESIKYILENIEMVDENILKEIARNIQIITNILVKASGEVISDHKEESYTPEIHYKRKKTKIPPFEYKGKYYNNIHEFCGLNNITYRTFNRRIYQYNFKALNEDNIDTIIDSMRKS